ncbi:hypothetical protein M406DRAFT_251912, partial [Cryphonectria parasitica EP155]
RVAILNMASPLSPGGGFLNGATSQEESLCMATTLLPALRDEFYRLPEVGCVYTPDVLVFRTMASSSSSSSSSDRWFVDVVSAAMLRLPETEIDEDTGLGKYVHAKDRELVIDKMRAVMRVFQAKQAKRVVLGAWGCGAYGNPVGEVARAWKKVLLGGNSKRVKQKGKAAEPRSAWDGIEEVVFAVKHAGMAEAFQAAFGKEHLEWVDDEVGDVESQGGEEDAEEKRQSDEVSERIRGLKLRIDRAPDPHVKAGLEAVLAGLLQSQKSMVSISSKEEYDSEQEEDVC